MTLGGARRSRAALESAVARPHATFEGDELYPDLAAKGAALVQNHSFVDGNKRTGAMACEFFIEVNDHLLLTTDEEFEELVLATAAGGLGAGSSGDPGTEKKIADLANV